MYCAACGTPLAPGLSFCNRCGMSLKERSEGKKDWVNSYLTAIAIIGIFGLIVMLGGAIALRNGAQLGEEVVGIFMLMTFAIVGVVELSLCRQLSRLNRAAEKRESVVTPLQPGMVNGVSGPQPRALAEPVPSVTENTTRTLEYSRKEPSS
jgi:predicted nucleic acid-binding Zn ribbon protein